MKFSPNHCSREPGGTLGPPTQRTYPNPGDVGSTVPPMFSLKREAYHQIPSQPMLRVLREDTGRQFGKESRRTYSEITVLTGNYPSQKIPIETPSGNWFFQNLPPSQNGVGGDIGNSRLEPRRWIHRRLEKFLEYSVLRPFVLGLNLPQPTRPSLKGRRGTRPAHRGCSPIQPTTFRGLKSMLREQVTIP